jgi:aerobic carbon-monoxide dehydrogenase medium subunit
VDLMTTALQPNELVREIRVPAASGDRVGSAYLKMGQKSSGFAICGAAAVVELDGTGAITNVGIGVTGVGSTAFRAATTEQALRGQKPSAALLRDACGTAAAGVTALDDIHASADYRLDLASVYSRRALEKALERAG